MAMITNLQLEAPVVIGGESIAVFEWRLANENIHQTLEVASRLQIALLKCDSNNATGFVIPTDAEALNMEWNRFKREWGYALEYRNLDPAAQEKILFVLAITDNEQLRTVNVKCRRVVYALASLMKIMYFCDSAKTQYGISQSDEKKIAKHIAYVDRIMADYIGDGSLGKDGQFQTGFEVADFAFIGTLNPPINLNESTIQEPSPAAPNVPTDDAPDTPSTVPLPGTHTNAK